MALKITYRSVSNKHVITRGAEHLRAQVPKIAKRRFKEASDELVTRMSQPGKRITYPVKWVSRAQRIAVIIKLKGNTRRNKGKFKNLPYHRTGAHSRGWKIKALKSGYSVTNTKKTAVYLYGDPSGNGQSPIHAGRWPKLSTQANIVLKKLPKLVRDDMVEIARKMPDK